MWPMFFVNLAITVFGTALQFPIHDGYDWFGHLLYLLMMVIMAIVTGIDPNRRRSGAVALAGFVMLWIFVPYIGTSSRVSDVVCGFLICLFAGIAAQSAAKHNKAKEPLWLLFLVATPGVGLGVGLLVAIWRFLWWLAGFRVVRKQPTTH